jgi:hypothetical protein
VPRRAIGLRIAIRFLAGASPRAVKRLQPTRPAGRFLRFVRLTGSLLDKGDQMKTKGITIMVILVCLSLTLPSFAVESVQARSLSIPQHGKLILNIPDSWKQSAGEPVGVFPTIIFSPEKGDDFEVLITPLWHPQNDPSFNKSEKVKSIIENDLRGMLPNAVENNATIQEIKGVNGTGYYFLLTDKAPKPGEYLYAVRAGIGVGDLLLSVTILSRSKNSEGITFTIKALQEAKQQYQ